jgi:hypothetical protein
MSNQVEPGSMSGSAAASRTAGGAADDPSPFGGGKLAGLNQEPDSPWAPYQNFHGRTSSWVTVTVIMIGFLVGGLGLVFGPMWVLFWVGLGLAVVGTMLAGAVHIMDDWY